MASNILVRDVMSKDVKKVRSDTTAQEVVATMTKFDVDSVIVVQSGKPVGIITTRDVIVRMVEHCLAPKAVIAREIYTNPLVTVSESATVEEAVSLMKKWRIKHLPVVENEKLVGLLTATDVMFKVPAMLSMMEELCHPTG
jgi:CBS domain-containing protein